MAEQGKIKWFNLQKGFGFIERENGGDIFVHINDWLGSKSGPSDGQTVMFEVVEGRKGVAAINVQPGTGGVSKKAPQRESPKDLQTKANKYSNDYRFLNPYNFVQYLPLRPTINNASANIELMGELSPPGHDRWVGLSGQIECQLKTITPLFVSDAEDVRKVKGSENKTHLSYRFFRLKNQKAIPASTLRGVVRSVFEAATNASFSNLDDKRLSYRLDSDEMRKLVPARLEKQDDGSWQARLLPGYAPFEVGQPQTRLYASPVAVYSPVQRNKNHGEAPPEIPEPTKWQHRKSYWAVLRDGKLGWRALALAETEEEAVAKKQELSRFNNKELKVQFGYFCRTDKNTINKHSERFFYCESSRTDVPDPLPVVDQIAREYLDLIEDYQTRHADEVAKGVGPEPKRGRSLKFSRYVYAKKEAQSIEDGELVYVYLINRYGKPSIHFMAPVSWPRVAYKRKIAQLLPAHLRRNSEMESLDSASRTFGWVHGDGKKSDGAYAGRVRFSHAFLVKEGEAIGEKTLAILGSPKPTTTRFYLVEEKTGKPQDNRSNKQAGYDGSNRLRGRKFYRHFFPQDEFMMRSEKSDQNRTIRDAEGPGANFTFKVSFENLAPVELGALIWSLTLDSKGYHKIGYGKPLGLGSAEITITELALFDHIARYSMLADTGVRPMVTDDQKKLVHLFRKAMCQKYVINDEVINLAENKDDPKTWRIVFEDLPNIVDLLSLLNKKPPKLPVHYPFSPQPNSQGQFEWFVGNTNLHGPKLEMGLAANDSGFPLLTKDAGKPSRPQRNRR